MRYRSRDEMPHVRFLRRIELDRQRRDAAMRDFNESMARERWANAVNRYADLMARYPFGLPSVPAESSLGFQFQLGRMNS